MDKKAEPPIQKREAPAERKTDPVFIRGTATPEVKK